MDMEKFLSNLKIRRCWIDRYPVSCSEMRPYHSKCKAYDARDGKWYQARVLNMGTQDGVKKVQIHFHGFRKR